MEAETLCRPDKQQQLWADCEIGVIIHYSRGLLGMQNLEGVPCDQAADASKLAPECLDTDQWLASAAELGAKYAVFVVLTVNCRWAEGQENTWIVWVRLLGLGRR